jgi:putative glutamine amidotransferase
VLLAAALSRNLPIVAVCRGIQLVVVAFGGKLYQDLSECASEVWKAVPLSHRSASGTDTIQRIDIEPVSLLAKYVCSSTLLVNSHHHQGIRIVRHRCKLLLALIGFTSKIAAFC